jgi:hypothetical protein
MPKNLKINDNLSVINLLVTGVPWINWNKGPGCGLKMDKYLCMAVTGQNCGCCVFADNEIVIGDCV